MSSVVHVRPVSAQQRSEEDHPDTPAIGRWYWVTYKKERGLACVTHIGSNYVQVTFVEEHSTLRIHNDNFWSECEFVEDADALLRANADRCKRELDGLLEDVKQLSSKLGVSPSLSLGSGSEAGATSLALSSSVPAAEYKTALVKAKEETLPALFEQIKEKSAEFAQWLSAQVIPMKAEAGKLKPAIDRVEDRIFSVELYAGLCEEVKLVKDGEPAALVEPVHLFQRRLYMDEECLANYDTGGMEFKNLPAFERWLCRKDNIDRILPFPRTVVAFQVRHRDKKREIAGFSDFIKMMQDKPLDKLTFLYIRNGAKVYRLSTEIDFGEKLFPDVDHPVLTAGDGLLYANLSSFGNGPKIIGEAEYLSMVDSEKKAHAEYERRLAEEAKKPKDKREHIWSPSPNERSDYYQPFTKDNVQYDDISKYIRSELEKHNRVVLVLQGLLDRSPALHPHPQWRLFEGAGFTQGLRLHRDADRVLSPGDKPDFEAFRARLNASIGPGTVTIGQEDTWERFEAKKENARRDNSYRFRRSEYRPSKYRPEGDPGPGRFARVVRLDRQGHVHYRWQKERKAGDGPPVGRKYGCKVSRVLNVDAYRPGDYKLFYTDPRTREEYLGWAPLLLAAEEYHAGRYGKVAPIAELPPKAPRAAPTGASGHLRMLRSWLGKAVRTTTVLMTRGGKRYEKGLLWRVTALEAGQFSITGIREEGQHKEYQGDEYRGVRCVSHRDLVVEPTVPSDPRWEFKMKKRKQAPIIDDEEEDDDE